MVHLKKGADGHLLKNAAGHLVKTCEPPFGNCIYCTDETPAGYSVVLSEIISCANSCIAPNAFTTDSKILDALPYTNGAYTLSQIASCVWRQIFILSPAITVQTYNTTNGTCSGDKNTYAYDRFLVQVALLSSPNW